jgi:hypothetical protein
LTVPDRCDQCDGGRTVAGTLAGSAGFAIVATIPRAFRHRHLGEVDAHIMHLALA